MDRKHLVFGIIAAALIGPFSHNIVAHSEDERLRMYSTAECAAFNQFPRTTSAFGLKRFKQEDRQQFLSLREQCQASLENR